MSEVLTTLNRQITELNKRYSSSEKWLFKIDGAKAEIRLRISLCWRTLGIDQGILYATSRHVLDRTRRSLSPNINKQKLLEFLVLNGVSYHNVSMWLESGITLEEFKLLIHYFGKFDRKETNPTAKKLIIDLADKGDRIFFTELFKDVIPEQVFMLLVHDEYNSRVKFPKDKALEVKSHPTVVKVKQSNKLLKRYAPAYDDKPKHYKEYAIVLRLQAKLGGLREESTPSGNIDLLTADKLIEVKSGECWKNGIGQLMAYGFHYPDRQKVLYLFNYQDLDLHNVLKICESLGIEVMLDQ